MNNKILLEVLDWIKTFAIAFVCVYLINLFLFSLATVNGQSMEPTLQHKQWLISSKISYIFGEPQRGDIVVLKNPYHDGTSDEKYFVKRVIGVPGDEIKIENQHVILNGEVLNEPYTDKLIEGEFNDVVVVPEGEYFVMGDNRGLMRSTDSRYFGTLEKDDIVGKIKAVIWPIKDFNWFGKGE